jgi:hypothetical protein
LYLRTFKQLLRSQQPPFDEKQYGVSSTYDLARQAQRDNLFHIERNRQGILRIFPGERFPKQTREAEEITAPASLEASTEISAAEYVHPAEVSEKTYETSDDVPAVSTERPGGYYGEYPAIETAPEIASETEPFQSGEMETREKTVKDGVKAAKEKPKTKPRTQRKPAAAAKTSRQERGAKNAAPKTRTTARGKAKKEDAG